METKWHSAQDEYVQWANRPLPKGYIDWIVQIGRKFKEFIGQSGLCLDVGCGNGVIGGKNYREIGYSYLDGGAVGVDPLPLLGAKPEWLGEYTRGVGEQFGFRDEVFDTVVLATTLDHLECPCDCLKECRRVLKPTGTLNIWVTCNQELTPYNARHLHRFERQIVEDQLHALGFTIVKEYVEPFEAIINRQYRTHGDTVFIKAWKDQFG